MKKSKFSAALALSVSFLLLFGAPLQAAGVVAAAAAARSAVRVSPAAFQIAMPGGVASLSMTQRLTAPSLTTSLQPFNSISPTLTTNRALPGMAAANALPAGSVQNAQTSPRPSLLTPASTKKDKDAVSFAVKANALSAGVKNAVSSVGSIAKASPSSAHALGSRLMGLLTRPLGNGGSAASVSPQEKTGLRSSGLKAADEVGADDAASSATSQEATKRHMVRTLEYVASVFSGHYAPLGWKGERFDVDLKKEFEKAKRSIEDSSYVTTRQFQNIVARFVASLRDYHVGIRFYSTEMAMLPVEIKGVNGKYYITYIERRALPKQLFPYEVGDRVIEIDGKPVSELVAELRNEKGENTFATDTSLAEMRLTKRSREAGDDVPEGVAKLKILSKDGRLSTAKLQWMHMDEMVPQDVPARDRGKLLEDADPFSDEIPPPEGEDSQPGGFSRLKEAIKKLVPLALNPLAELMSNMFGPESDNPFQIGGKQSFIPELGKILWQAPPMLPFKAYIYENEEGRKIGYIRIASYMGDQMAAEMFGQIMVKFETETDSLVLDQVNNPGGNLFYMYALISRLIDQPIKASPQRIIVGESDAYEAAAALRMDPMIRTDMDAMRALGPSLAGYPVTLKVWKQFAAYFRFVLSELKAGRRLMEPQSIMGIDEIVPHPTQRYTKPIMILINELDFSAADFLPAMLQDAGRVTTFGVRTSGAGGAVRPTQFPNQFGIAMIAYTWTLALRTNGQPIENLGVEPDIDHRITERDLTDGFVDTKEAVNIGVNLMMETAPAPAEKTEPVEETPPSSEPEA